MDYQTIVTMLAALLFLAWRQEKEHTRKLLAVWGYRGQAQ